jgi:cytochrome c oxidase subunit 2
MPCSAGAPNIMPVVGGKRGLSKAVFRRRSASNNVGAQFHDFLLWVISAIAIFVLALLLTVVVKFNARTNPVPSRTTHNTTIEVLWTVVPVLILVTIAVPSFRLLFFQLNVPKADVTVKAIGKQWFWSYSYPDSKFEFDSLLACDQERTKCEQPRLLAVDNEMVVPVNKVVHVLTTGSDVIHAFAVPAFGIKIDAIPGRINETWFKAERRANITDSAPSFAARTTPSCQSWCEW